MKKCPKCGCKTFYVNAHVVQTWKVDSCGEFEECVIDCVTVAHYPNNEDLWECTDCGYESGGNNFEVE